VFSSLRRHFRQGPLLAGESDQQRDARLCAKSQQPNRAQRLSRHCRPQEKDQHHKFDDNPYLINCHNGTLDLRTGELRSHERSDLFTKSVNAEYDVDSKREFFDEFLETIQPDPGVRAFLQRSIGYSLLGTVRERSFWILHGTGNNGKSIFVNLFNNLLGDYASGTTTASIMLSKGSASRMISRVSAASGSSSFRRPKKMSGSTRAWSKRCQLAIR
jgi:putative DNA primase/helicase